MLLINPIYCQTRRDRNIVERKIEKAEDTSDVVTELRKLGPYQTC